MDNAEPAALRGIFAAYNSEQFAFFTWDLGLNLIYGDKLLADFFDLDLPELAEGLTIEKILERVCEDDRPRLAHAIHKAILSGEPYSETYSICARSGERRRVAAFGRCFRYSDGTPSHYAGFLVEASSEQLVIGNPIEAHCWAALTLAENQGLDLPARYLLSALGALEGRSGLN